MILPKAVLRIICSITAPDLGYGQNVVARNLRPHGFGEGNRVEHFSEFWRFCSTFGFTHPEFGPAGRQKWGIHPGFCLLLVPRAKAGFTGKAAINKITQRQTAVTGKMPFLAICPRMPWTSIQEASSHRSLPSALHFIKKSDAWNMQMAGHYVSDIHTNA